jgi:hypothetical protein
MNVLCPSCQKMITVPDQYAGQTMKCPLCSHLFPAPVLPATNPPPMPVEPASTPATTATAVLPPLEPPTTAFTPGASSSKGDVYSFASPPVQTPLYPRSGVEPPARARADRDSGAPASQPSAVPPPPPPPGNYVHTRTIYISPNRVQWIAPVALGLVFLLMFATWVWKPGAEEETQSGWGTGIGHNFTLLGFFYLLFFLAAFAVALASVIVPRLQVSLPPWARPLWPWRSAIVGGLAFLALMFLVLEMLSGFGLERALGKDGYYLARRTFALDLTFLLFLAAIAGAALEFWLVVRKSRPLPKIDISW